jgi:hypothetical protein
MNFDLASFGLGFFTLPILLLLASRALIKKPRDAKPFRER